VFVADADMQLDCLRQGDVLEGIPFPLLDFKKLSVLSQIRSDRSNPSPAIVPATYLHRNDPTYYWAQLPVKLAFAAVISNCCEVEPRHGKLLQPAFMVARLIPIKDSITENPGKLDSLKANKDPRSVAPGYIDYFYIETHPRLDGKDWMVDYSQVASIPNSEFPGIMKKKLLQMKVHDRVKFKIKLAAYYGRIDDDEAADALPEAW
jgi:hypothetical protein